MKYSVSLFYRLEDKSDAKNLVIKERLTACIVDAANADEAFGKAYRISKDEFGEFDLVYNKTIEIDLTTTANKA